MVVKSLNDLITNINQAIEDFCSIKNAIADKGIAIPSGTPTSQYSKLINDIQTKQFNELVTDNLVFSLSDIEFSNYDTKISLGNPSFYNLPIGDIPKTVEIVSKCGTVSNFLFSYGNNGNGGTFALTQDEFVGWNNNVKYSNMNNIQGKTRHIVCTNENKNIAIFVNGVQIIDQELDFPCNPNDYNFSINSLRDQNPLKTQNSTLYVLRFYKKRLSESEIINNFKIFNQKYTIEI